MSSISVAGDTSGSITLQAPAVSGSTVLTLPATTATLITDSAGILNIGSGQVYKDASGNVGIGTSSPQAGYKQTIQYEFGGGIIACQALIAYGSSPTLNFRQIGGTIATPSASSTTIINLIGSSTSDGTTLFNTVAIQGGMEGTAVTGSHPTYIGFATTQSGTTSRLERMRIDSSGNVGIGTASPSGKLDVAGTIKTLGYTVATLPTGVVGARAYVTNALAPTFGATVVTGGAVTIPVFYNGTNWIVG